jgi:serine protease AprX
MAQNKTRLIGFLLFFSVLSGFVEAQNKYWIRFKDKNGTPFTTSNPSAYLSNKSIARRTAKGIPVTLSDLPVNPNYVSQIENLNGVTVLYASKWLNGVVASITNTTMLMTINGLSFVANSNRVNRYKIDLGIESVEPLKQDLQNYRLTSPANLNYGPSLAQAQQLNVTCLHTAGFSGQGMTIAVLDNGFSNANINPVFDSIRARNGILGTYDFVNSESNVYNDGSHGAMVFSTMAGYKSGDLIGTAYKANYWLFTTEEDAAETISEEYNWIRGAEFADSVGADILTTSLGYFKFDGNLNDHVTNDLNGRIAPMSIAATMAARKGLLVLNSAGNSGGGATTIGVPADADSIISVGAVDINGLRTGFSSVGPTIDGRIKPDLMARGGQAIVCMPSGAFANANGTSFSCPILAGAAACFWQKHPTLSNIKVIDTLKKMASQASAPDNLMGWGIPDLCKVIGIKENIPNGTSLQISVAPNPSNGLFTVSLPHPLSTSWEINVYSLVGQNIQQSEFDGTQTQATLNLMTQPAGIYFLKVKHRYGTSVLKLIKN